jgi:uncharacterized protein (DUF1800 family)
MFRPRPLRSSTVLAFCCAAFNTGANAQASRSAETRVARTSGAATRASAQARTKEEQALHVLNRLTFGPRPGDVDRVLRIGIDRWIDQQLHPENIEDRAGVAALSGCPMWTSPPQVPQQPVTSTGTATVAGRVTGQLVIRVGFGGFRLITRDSARRLGTRGQTFLDNGQLLACRLARVEASELQLLEVMTDFWENHFSVYSGKIPHRESLIEWDRSVIRANALGRFRDLLGAVAHSPMMLHYLDNAMSSATREYPTTLEYATALRSGTDPVIAERPGFGPNTGLNENYARELLELHTMGVDGGYTQADVVGAARAFTGWSHSNLRPRFTAMPRTGSMQVQPNTPTPIYQMISASPAFVFDSARHDAGEKKFLGHTLQAGRGTEDAEEVLDLIARHPSTARFLARKLAVRFVSDDPPPALIDGAAATFLRTDGDIREVVRTIVTSPEFRSPAAYGAKIKSPQELVLSTRRALAAPVDTAAEIIDLLIMLDQPPFGYITPEGWPETGNDWMNAGALMARMQLAMRIGRGELRTIPVEAWPAWKVLVNAPFDKQVDGVIEKLLNGRASPRFRRAAQVARPTGRERDSALARERALRELITLALGSPEFQRR